MRLTLPLLLTALVANTTARKLNLKNKVHSIKARSKAGKKLLSKARRLDEEQEVDYSWLPGYTFQFQKCYQWEAYGREENENKEKAIVFRACPSGDCSYNCNYGSDYIVQLIDYVEAYTQAKQDLRDYNCQVVEENCACDDDQADDEACQANCYAAAGLDYCQEEEEDQFDVADYADCAQLEMNNDNNNRKLDEDNGYYGGLYCSDDNSAVHMGVFSDEECSVRVSSDIYYEAMGSALPYSSKSVIGSDCVSCLSPYYEDGDDDNVDEQINEYCAEVYEQAGKCETDLPIDYPSTDACIYINNVVPNLEVLYKGEKAKGQGASVWTWVFAATTVGLAGFIGYQTYSKKKTSIDLADQGSSMT